MITDLAPTAHQAADRDFMLAVICTLIRRLNRHADANTDAPSVIITQADVSDVVGWHLQQTMDPGNPSVILTATPPRQERTQ